MTRLDDQLRDALRQSASVDLNPQVDLDTLRGMLSETYAGRHRFLTVVGILKLVAFAVFGTVAVVMMLQAETSRGQILWAACFVASVSAVGIGILLHWLNLTRNALLREIKRVELRVAALPGSDGSAN